MAAGNQILPGVSIDQITQPRVYFYFDLRRMTTQVLPDIEKPRRSFPGILGVARTEPGRYSKVPPGAFVGNMD